MPAQMIKSEQLSQKGVLLVEGQQGEIVHWLFIASNLGTTVHQEEMDVIYVIRDISKQLETIDIIFVIGQDDEYV